MKLIPKKLEHFELLQADWLKKKKEICSQYLKFNVSNEYANCD